MMKHTRQYTKRPYRPNLSALAAYLQPLKVNTESVQTLLGEAIMCQPITKRMNALAKVSRGLDQTHPEYSRKSRHKLGQLLQQAIGQVYQLERDHQARLITLDVMRECALHLLEIHQHAKDTKQQIDPEQVYLLAVDMLEQLETEQVTA